MRTFDQIALGVPEILLPQAGTDLVRWAVIACDQYTSEPEYWAKIAALIGEAPSALNLIYPEVYLREANPDARIARIRGAMARYRAQGLFEAVEGFVYVERTTGAKIRKGLVACLDLEAYDFRKSSTTLIRASEGTILERIPPRVKIREGAPIEIPHIMVLFDDPGSFDAFDPQNAVRDHLSDPCNCTARECGLEVLPRLRTHGGDESAL